MKPTRRSSSCLGSVASIQTGPFGSQLHASDYEADGTPIITVEHLGDNEILRNNLPLVSNRDRQRLDRYSLRAGDIVFTRVGAIDRRAYVSSLEDGWLFSGRLLRVRPSSRVDGRFLSHLLGQHQTVQWIRSHAVGSTMACLNTSILSAVPVRLPELPEQRRIAEILDTLDEVIRRTEQIVAKLKQVKQGLLHDLLTRGIDKRGKIRDLDPGVRCPTSWSVAPLDMVAELSSGTTPPRSMPRYWVGGSIPWVKTGEVNFNVISATEELVSDVALSETPLRLYPAGTLLVAMYGQGATRGRCAMLAVAATTNQACAAIQPKSGMLDGGFLFAFLKAKYEQIRGLGHGSNQTNLSGALLGRFNVVIPPLDEQHRIVAVLDSHDLRVGAEEAGLNKLRLLKYGLMEDLLTGRVRVTSERTIPRRSEPDQGQLGLEL